LQESLAMAEDVVAFETAIAKFTIDPDQLRDPVKVIISPCS
jgi:hypothetical protein